ncbi:MAG: hypothetical protein COT73_07475, partial [Bdellovibrio sp. CG10_big_fil_rev_8_21_14_0_10_47_8]
MVLRFFIFVYDEIIFFFYRFVAVPLALGLLQIVRRVLPVKIQEMMIDRAMRNLQALPGSPLWIHASSGEIEYAKSVIRDLKIHFPQVPVLVTYFSPSAKRLIQNFPGIDLAMALPWDRAKDLEKFLDFYRPKACLFARTDVWPKLSNQLRLRKIPSLLFAATLAA